MKKNWINIIFCIILSQAGAAQTEGFGYFSRLDPVNVPGFYNIKLTPAFCSLLKTDFSDARIINDSGKWVPHFLRCPAFEKNYASIKAELKFTKSNTGSSTTLIIKSSQKILSNLELTIRNTSAQRFCTLSGSDDQKNWFVINDSILVNPSADESGTQNNFLMNFPPGNYKYYKISILNNSKDPFDIIKVETNISAAVAYRSEDPISQNPPAKIEQRDSGKISLIKVTQQQAYHFEYLNIGIKGVKYFYRQLELYIPENDMHSFSDPGRLAQSYSISNNSTLQFKVPLNNVKVFYLIIKNEDNLPLTVTGVKTSFNNRYLTSYLEKGAGYKLMMGNILATAPDYDLGKNSGIVPDSIPFLAVGDITKVAQMMPVTKRDSSSRWLLWTAILFTLLILLFLTYKMLKEVEKRKQHDNL